MSAMGSSTSGQRGTMEQEQQEQGDPEPPSSPPPPTMTMTMTMTRKRRNPSKTKGARLCDASTAEVVSSPPTPAPSLSSSQTSPTTLKDLTAVCQSSGRRHVDCNGMDGRGTNKRHKKSKDQDREDMEWICAECKEAECGLVTVTDGTNKDDDDDDDTSRFLFCDGPCHRIFHIPCAGLSRLPDDECEEWLCTDCVKREHACAYCSEYGRDGADVFPCRESHCGLFFHEACLQARHVDYTYHKQKRSNYVGVDQGNHKHEEEGLVDENDDDDDNYDDEPLVPSFTCPAHHCWTCTQKDMIQLEKEEAERERHREAELLRNGSQKMAAKKRRSKKRDTIFKSKTESRIYRCLYCPTAYHSTCIPPVARFHELAVLCHEHALSHKLPELDLSSSIQSKLEEKVDQTLMRLHGVRKQANRPKKNGFWDQRKTSVNPFIPGLWGDRFDSYEQQLLQCIKSSSSTIERQQPEDSAQANLHECPENGDDIATVDPSSSLSMVLDGSLPFCLPVDIKSEVYSKPPAYIHIQSLKYSANKDNRPKKIKAADKEDQERCKCTGSTCGDDCFNRAIMTECAGPRNCSLGTKDCGNRGLTKRQFVKCQPMRERGKGWGLVTLEAVPKGKIVHEYVGEVIDEKEKTERLLAWNKDHPNDPNFYVMALSGGYYVDAREYANQSRFINHSCAPNCKVVSVNVKGHIRNGIYSIRDIQAGEFLSYDYHFDTKQGDRFVCRCGASNCRGTMKGGGKNDKDDPLLKRPLNWRDAKARYEADRTYLNELNGRDVVSLVDFLLPDADHPNETIATGPIEKHRPVAIRHRIFLWRNVKLGSDFVSRNSRLEATGHSGVRQSGFQEKVENA